MAEPATCLLDKQKDLLKFGSPAPMQEPCVGGSSTGGQTRLDS